MELGRVTMQDLLLAALEDLGQDELEKFKFKLHTAAAPEGRRKIPLGRLEKAKRLNLAELLVEFYEDKAAAQVVAIFEDIGLKYNASKLRTGMVTYANSVAENQVQGYKKKYAETVMEEYQLIEDQNSLLGERTPFNARYTELLMIRKHRPQKQREHELAATGRRHMEVLEKIASDYSSTDIESLFEPDQSGETPRTVVLQGPAGIGKTMTVQKIMLGWAAGELYQEAFDYVFCIRCRELSLAEANSLANLILEQCQDIYAPVKKILAHPEKLLFIVDGFDELRFSLEPETNQPCDSPYSKVPLESLLSSLLRKKLLPKSHLLITTRPGAAEKLQGCLKFPRFTEILGFSEKGRRDYFLKFFADDQKANLALRFVENTTVVSTICFIPMVCWIICSVIEVDLETENEIADTLDTTTKVFVQFTHSLLKHVSSKLKSPLDEIRKLCSLARASLLEQKILFEEEDLKEHNLDGSHLKDLFLERRTFRKGIGCHSLYSFLHLCFQEFFAAMFYILQEAPTGDPHDYEGDLKRLLVACEKPGNEHLTLTVRFIFGLSSEKVRVFLEQTLQCRTSDLVKPLLLQRAAEVAGEDPPRTGYRLLTFFHCLFESQEVAFAKQVMHHFPTIDLSFKTISVLDCRVLAFCLQHSPVQDHSVDLTFCRLKSHHVKALASGIKNCTTLEFGSNKLGNSGVTVLCAILKELDCQVTTLNLGENYLTDACAQDLCTTLSTSHKLYTLNLQDNSFTEASLPFLICLMKTCTSLTIIHLNENGFGDKGQKYLRKQEERLGRPFLLWL